LNGKHVLSLRGLVDSRVGTGEEQVASINEGNPSRKRDRQAFHGNNDAGEWSALEQIKTGVALNSTRRLSFASVSYTHLDVYKRQTLLIAVGVALETMRQIDSQLMMRNYEGFLKR